MTSRVPSRHGVAWRGTQRENHRPLDTQGGRRCACRYLKHGKEGNDNGWARLVMILSKSSETDVVVLPGHEGAT